MFQFPAFASYPYVFEGKIPCIKAWKPSLPFGLAEPEVPDRHGKNDFPSFQGGFPHSEIHGSKPIPGSPWLNAGYHVLHRLLLPRHPPNALFALDLTQKEQGPFRLPPSWKAAVKSSTTLSWLWFSAMTVTY